MAKTDELWFEVDTVDRNTIVKIKREGAIVGDIAELTSYNKEDLMDLTDDYIIFLMQNHTEKMKDELKNQTLDEFHEGLIEEYINQLDMLGEPVVNDDNTFAAGYEWTCGGQCDDEIAELVSNSNNLDERTKQALLNLTKIWAQVREEYGLIDYGDNPEIEQTWNELVPLTFFDNRDEAEKYAEDNTEQMYDYALKN